jgi:hypothetical protein
MLATFKRISLSADSEIRTAVVGVDQRPGIAEGSAEGATRVRLCTLGAQLGFYLERLRFFFATLTQRQRVSRYICKILQLISLL